MSGRVSSVVSYENALGSLDNYTLQIPIQLDADGNIINYRETIDGILGKNNIVTYGEGWDADAPYKHIIVTHGINTEYTAGNNTRGVTEHLFGLLDVYTTNVTSTNATLNISGKGLTFSDSTKNKAAALLNLPLKTVLCAYGRALGLDMNYTDAQNIMDRWANDDRWTRGILPYLKYCFGTVKENAKTQVYTTEEGLEKIKELLIEYGMFGNFNPKTYNSLDEFTTPPTVPLTDVVDWLVYNTDEAYVRLHLRDALIFALQHDFVDYGGLGDASGGFTSSLGATDPYSYTFRSLEHTRVKGNFIVMNSTNTTGYTQHPNNGNIQLEDTVHQCVIKVQYDPRTNTFSVTQNATITEVNTYKYLLHGGYSSNPIGIFNIFEGSSASLPKLPNATLPSAGVPLSTTYPSWSGNGGYISMPKSDYITDQDNKTVVYPISIPLQDPELVPSTQDDIQGGNNVTNNILPFVIPLPFDTPNFDFDPDVDLPDVDTPDVDIPDPTIPIIPLIPLTLGGNNGFVNLYNPTQAQVAELTQYLWTTNILDNLKKLFQDPMEAIISLSLLYATPHVAEQQKNIIVGNIDTGVEDCNVIDQQYIDIDCGTIKFNRYYNNVLDYISTTIEVYLPFIGFVSIDVGSAMDKEINIRYRIDVLTGDCVVFIYIGGLLLYSFNGNCSIKLPISASNYSSQITGAASLIGSIGIGLLSKNPATALIGAAASVPSLLSHQVQRGGNLIGNAGAMGQRKPYLIITRQKPYNPDNYNKYYGYPSNETVSLSSCIGTGYTRVKDIRLRDIYTYDEDAKVVATDDEMAIIERQLKEGVIL